MSGYVTGVPCWVCVIDLCNIYIFACVFWAVVSVVVVWVLASLGVLRYAEFYDHVSCPYLVCLQVVVRFSSDLVGLYLFDRDLCFCFVMGGLGVWFVIAMGTYV